MLLRPRPGRVVDVNAVRTIAAAAGVNARRVVVRRESDIVAAELAPLRWFTHWIGLEGWASLLIAVAGVFSLMRLWVSSLRPEIGVRRAVGARRGSIMGFVLVRAALAGAWGVAVAVWFGPAAHDALATSIQGLPDWATASMARYGVLLLVIAMTGALVPAWRATATAPAELVGAADG